ncbi:DUF4760 domain-containing protein [Burkholderia cenocepacia]
MTKPKKILLLLLLVYVGAIGFLIWEEAIHPLGHAPTGAIQPLFGFGKTEWPVVGTISGAVLGWMVTALVSLHNSIKQHTINTLLQSRLSATYQGLVPVLDATYPTTNEGRTEVKPGDWLSDDKGVKDSLAAYRYFLNYYEFLAVGIKAGDLHAELLRQSMRGIVCVNVRAARAYISHLRQPEIRVYANLLELYEQWLQPTRWERFVEWWSGHSDPKDVKDKRAKRDLAMRCRLEAERSTKQKDIEDALKYAEADVSGISCAEVG